MRGCAKTLTTMRLTTPNRAIQQRAPTELRSLHADKTTRTVQISREHRQSCDLNTRTKQSELCKSAESTDRVAISTRGQNNPNCAIQQRAPTELRSLHADKTIRTAQFSREHRQRCDLYTRTKQPELCKSAESTDRVAISTAQ